MTEHFLDRSVTQPFWDNSVEPRLVIDPGDVVVFDCPECGDQFTPDWTTEDMLNADGSKFHALIGSVYINSARPGDVLEVEVLRLEHHNWGWTAFSPGFGLLDDDFRAEPYIHHWRIEGDDCHFGVNGIVVPYEPFCGVMGVAPAETGRFRTIPPHFGGGNMDTRDMGVGSTVWFPVFADGALFSCGDCHAAQGHGEVCGTGIEAPITVTLRFNVRKDMSIREVQFRAPSPLTRTDNRGYHVTTAHGPDLWQNSQNALRYTLDWMVQEHGITRGQAYALASCASDLKITEIVDAPNWIVGCYTPLSIFR
ncbi:MAG: acetamidase/formamidase family protein [Anaerolineae bacterium]|nr:acetamidase/formamidase family protein [Anaerolineae bacterium]